MVRACCRHTNGKGRQVAEEVLRCSKELQQWNPSGGYCVTIPYHYGEQRELKPDELLEIAAGIDVAGCRASGRRERRNWCECTCGRTCEASQITGTKGTGIGPVRGRTNNRKISPLHQT
jgi:hypothetical protein